ncbi:hypothetical protein OKW40_000737 [Paraburkholderia sp. RAU6.4a]
MKTQTWRAVPTYVLIAVVNKELQLDASLYTLLQILSVFVFAKTEISRTLRPGPSLPEMPQSQPTESVINLTGHY